MAIETIAIHHEMDDGDSTPPAEHNAAASVAVVDEHDAIHAAVELWCSKAQPPIRFVGNYFSAEQFLAEHPSPSASGVGPIVLELQKQHNGVDFVALDRIVARRYRVIVYSHFATDEVILTAMDRGAVTYLTKSESKDHLIDAIRAAGTDTPHVGPRMALAMLNDSTVGRANLAPRERSADRVVWYRKQGSRCPPTADRTDDRSHPPTASAGQVRRGGTACHHQGRTGGPGHSGRHRQRRRHLVRAQGSSRQRRLNPTREAEAAQRVCTAKARALPNLHSESARIT